MKYIMPFFLLLFCYLMKKYFFKNSSVDGSINRKKNTEKKYITRFAMVTICTSGGIYYIKLSEKKILMHFIVKFKTTCMKFLL